MDLIIDAEDFNNGGAYLPSNPPNAFNEPMLYNGIGATENVDFSSASSSPFNTYRTGTGIFIIEHGDGQPQPIDYYLQVDDGDWFNYTRQFPSGAYNIYARVAKKVGDACTLELSEVTSDRTQPGQTTVHKGYFDDVTGSSGEFVWRVLRGADGHPLLLNLSGEQTLRVTVDSGDCKFHRLLLKTPLLTQISGRGVGLGASRGSISATSALSGRSVGLASGQASPTVTHAVTGSGVGMGSGQAGLLGAGQLGPAASLGIGGGSGAMTGVGAMAGATVGIGSHGGALLVVTLFEPGNVIVGWGSGEALIEGWKCGYGVPFLYKRKDHTEDTEFFLEVYMRATSGTVSAILRDDTTGQHLQLSRIDTAATTFDRLRSGAFTLVDGHEYSVCFGIEGADGEFKSAKLISKVP